MSGTVLVCQWCGQPAQQPATWWNDKPQCADDAACDKRIFDKEPTR